MERFISYFPENDLFTVETETEVNGVTLVAPEKEKKTQYHTAVREGVEESSGILGDKKDVRNLIRHHLMGKIRDKAYSIWLVEVEYNPDITSVFRNHFKEALKNNLDSVKKHNGLFEKDKLQWIKLSTLDRKKYMFRPWYKRFIPKIIEVLK